MGKKGRRLYTKEFKEEAVKLIKKQGYPISEAARNLGITPVCLGDGNVQMKRAKTVNPILGAWQICKLN